MSVQERDPCPHRIFDDIGGAFAMGAIGGGVWNSVKGARNSPRGERLLGSVTAVKARAPVIGGAPRPLAQPAQLPQASVVGTRFLQGYAHLDFTWERCKIAAGMGFRWLSGFPIPDGQNP